MSTINWCNSKNQCPILTCSMFHIFAEKGLNNLFSDSELSIVDKVEIFRELLEGKAVRFEFYQWILKMVDT